MINNHFQSLRHARYKVIQGPCYRKETARSRVNFDM